MGKKNKNVIIQDDVNHNILNIISPSGITYSETEANIGENYGKVYTVSKYPSDAEYGWLAPLCNLEGTSTYIEFIYADPARLIKVYNEKHTQLAGTYETLKEESEKQNNLLARKNIEVVWELTRENGQDCTDDDQEDETIEKLLELLN